MIFPEPKRCPFTEWQLVDERRMKNMPVVQGTERLIQGTVEWVSVSTDCAKMRTHADYIVDFLAICITGLSGQATRKTPVESQLQ